MKKTDSFKNLFWDVIFLIVNGFLTFLLFYFGQDLGIKKSILKSMLASEIALLVNMLYYTAVVSEARSLKELKKQLDENPRIVGYAASGAFGFSLVFTNIIYPSVIKNLVIMIVIMVFKLLAIARELIYYKNITNRKEVKRLNKLLDEIVEKNRKLSKKNGILKDKLYDAEDYIIYLEEKNEELVEEIKNLLNDLKAG